MLKYISNTKTIDIYFVVTNLYNSKFKLAKICLTEHHLESYFDYNGL